MCCWVKVLARSRVPRRVPPYSLPAPHPSRLPTATNCNHAQPPTPRPRFILSLQCLHLLFFTSWSSLLTSAQQPPQENFHLSTPALGLGPTLLSPANILSISFRTSPATSLRILDHNFSDARLLPRVISCDGGESGASTLLDPRTRRTPSRHVMRLVAVYIRGSPSQEDITARFAKLVDRFLNSR